MIKLIIFDWDDTIVLGAKEGYYSCYRLAIKKVGVVLPEKVLDERIRQNWGKKYQIEIKGLLKEHPEKVKAAVAEFERLSFGKTFFKQLKLLPGTRKLLKDLSQKYILAIVTGSEPRRRNLVAEYLQIPKVFKQSVSSHQITDSKKTKPHPYAVNLILKKHRIRPEQALLVGDGKPDMQMAKRAGVKTVAVLTGNLSRNQAEKLRVDKIIPNLTYLKTFLKEEEIF